MSSRAQRLKTLHDVQPFDWGVDHSMPPLERMDRFDNVHAGLYAVPPPEPAVAPQLMVPPPEVVQPAIDPSAIEREAFTKGYAQGERAGAEAAAVRGEAMLRRLAQTLEELGGLRSDMIRKSEQQLVQLAIAIATRVIQREISLDADLLIAMARVALDRLGESSSATIRLHPDDYAAAMKAGSGRLSTDTVTVVADPIVNRGGCLVESDFGLIDLGVSSQVNEIATALLGEDARVMEEAAVHAVR